MALKIKYDIGTAVSVGLVVGKHPDGSDLEQEVVFLPGAILPKNVAPRLVKKVRDGDEHLSKLIEEVDAEPAPVRGVSPEIVAPLIEEETNPFVEQAQEPVDYDEWKRSELDAELAKRTEAGKTIEVTGTGQGGNVVAADIAAALKADDEAQAAS